MVTISDAIVMTGPSFFPFSLEPAYHTSDAQDVPEVKAVLGRGLSAGNIKAGDDVFFECHAQARPRVSKLAWNHNGEEVHHNVSAGIIISNYTLVLQSLQRVQAGSYTCLAHNLVGVGRSQPVFLKVKSPIIAPSDYPVFLHLKNLLSGQLHGDDEDVKTTALQWISNQEADFYEDDVPEVKAVLGRGLSAGNIKAGDDVFFECHAQARPRVSKLAWNHNVTVRCSLDSFPSNVTFSWRFNNSGEMVDISAEHITNSGLNSTLSYVARTELDFGTLLCWGTNILGAQAKPCKFQVIPLELPKPPTNCTLLDAGGVGIIEKKERSDPHVVHEVMSEDQRFLDSGYGVIEFPGHFIRDQSHSGQNKRPEYRNKKTETATKLTASGNNLKLNSVADIYRFETPAVHTGDARRLRGRSRSRDAYKRPLTENIRTKRNSGSKHKITDGLKHLNGTNTTLAENDILVTCANDNNPVLPVHFNAVVYNANKNELMAKISNATESVFFFKSLQQTSDLDIVLYATNGHGNSSLVVLRTRASIDIAEKRTVPVDRRSSPSRIDITQAKEGPPQGVSARTNTRVLVPILAVVLGVLGTVGLLAVAAVFYYSYKKSSRTSHIKSLADPKSESTDSNPDVIPTIDDTDDTATTMIPTITETILWPSYSGASIGPPPISQYPGEPSRPAGVGVTTQKFRRKAADDTSLKSYTQKSTSSATFILQDSPEIILLNQNKNVGNTATEGQLKELRTLDFKCSTRAQSNSGEQSLTTRREMGTPVGRNVKDFKKFNTQSSDADLMASMNVFHDFYTESSKFSDSIKTLNVNITPPPMFRKNSLISKSTSNVNFD
ncbi:Immunoglobulin-like domain [Trinorchestia longiramus]|nr:Immunoglobulin-like domain [Trinorchestia longiramus]